MVLSPAEDRQTSAADRAQAAVTAALLSELIRECDTKIAAAERDATAAQRATDRHRRHLVQARRLRNERAELVAMKQRLALRFRDAGSALP